MTDVSGSAVRPGDGEAAGVPGGSKAATIGSPLPDNWQRLLAFEQERADRNWDERCAFERGLRDSEARLAAVQDELNLLRAQANRAEQAWTAERDSLGTAAEAERQRHRREQAVLQARLTASLDSSDVANRANSESKRQLEGEIEQLRAALAEQSKRYAEIESDLRTRSKDLAQAEKARDTNSDRLEVVAARLSEAFQQQQSLRKGLDEAKAKATALQSDLDETEVLATCLREDGARLQERVTMLEEREAALVIELSQSEEWVSRLSADRAAAEGLAQSARSGHVRADKRAQDAEAEAVRLREEVSFLRQHVRATREAATAASVAVNAAGPVAGTLPGDALPRVTTWRREDVVTSEKIAAPTDTAADPVAVDQKVRELTAALQTARRNGDAQLRERFDEIAALTRMLREEEFKRTAMSEKVEWLRQIVEFYRKLPAWWKAMPKAWQRAAQGRRLQEIGLFDGDAYLARHADVRAAGVDPLRHYLNHGIIENRVR